MGGANSPDSTMERRSTLSNDGGAVLWTSSIPHYRDSKFFSRGCRGLIRRVEVYCQDATPFPGLLGTIDVYLTPIIGMSHLYMAPIALAALAPAAWRAATFNIEWNYDSLQIVLISSHAGMEYAYDVTLPWDRHTHAAHLAPWTPLDSRLWIRVVYAAQTPGDVPISGITNNIEIPARATESIGFTTRTVPAQVAGVDGDNWVRWNGPGTVKLAIWRVISDAALAALSPYVEVDGERVQLVDTGMDDLAAIIDPTADQEGITWPRYDATNHVYTLQMMLDFPFWGGVDVGATNDTLAAQDIEIYALIYTLR